MRKFPTRCQIVDPEGSKTEGGLPRTAPSKSLPHIGKKGTAYDEGGGKVRIVLDDGTELDGLDCWWVPLDEPVSAGAG